MSPLHIAVTLKDPTILEILLADSRFDVNIIDFVSILWNMFSKKKVKIYQQDSDTPLMHAKKQNKFLSFALLLNHPDIVPEIFDKYGVCFFFF